MTLQELREKAIERLSEMLDSSDSDVQLLAVQIALQTRTDNLEIPGHCCTIHPANNDAPTAFHQGPICPDPYETQTGFRPWAMSQVSD